MAYASKGASALIHAAATGSRRAPRNCRLSDRAYRRGLPAPKRPAAWLCLGPRWPGSAHCLGRSPSANLSTRFPARQARSRRRRLSPRRSREDPLMTSGRQGAASATDLMSPAPATRARDGAKGSRTARDATSPARGKKSSSRASTASSETKTATPTPAGKSLDRAQHALDQAAQTEKQLRASLKKHSKAVSAAKDDLDRRDRDLKAMKSQLKTAKKSRKRAARELSQAPKPAAATR